MSRNPGVQYASVQEAVALVSDARAYQVKAWPSTSQGNGGERPLEEWFILLDVYIAKLKAVYAETPSYVGDGDRANTEGRKRIVKYAAIVANLTLWLLQAAEGHAQTGQEPAQDDNAS